MQTSPVLSAAPARPCQCCGFVVATKQPDGQKSPFVVGQISATSLPRPFPARGALAIVTNAGGDAVDAAASARSGIAGRVHPVSDNVSARRRRHSPVEPFGEDGRLRTAKPCGPGTRCWCQVGGGFCEPNRARQRLQSADDGDKTNSSPGRARYKPSNHCAGNAGVPPLNPVCSC